MGTAKVEGVWQRDGSSRIFVYKSIPHYCIDFVSPRRTYTVTEFKACAMHAIKDIVRRGKMPILVGGTGFWIDALVYNVNLPEVAPNTRLRKNLEKQSRAELFSLLKSLDPERAKTVEPANPRRLVRAIEIAKSLGIVPRIKKTHLYDVVWLGLNPPERVLQKRIEKRIRTWTRSTSGDGNIITETKKLLKKRISRKRMREFGFEYAAVLTFLEHRITRCQLVEKLIADSMHYAKRQMRWFKRNQEIFWIQDIAKAEKLVTIWLHARIKKRGSYQP